AGNSGEVSCSVASLKPNDFGLFDMLGNIRCWCQNYWQRDYGETKDSTIFDDKEGPLNVNDKESRSWRGASFVELPGLVRSALRSTSVPHFDIMANGFRPARTLP